MADWVIVVDDDSANLKIAGHILSHAGYKVTALQSGKLLLDYMNEKGKPDLILLDIKMPEMDGFDVLRMMRSTIDPAGEIPVIFLTADEKDETETRGLEEGAVDFIKKPFVPKVLTLRVQHIIDLNHLQRNLEQEVRKKTDENERLFMHVVSSLADAIDAKDTYTNGHSGRVAGYSKEIAKRMGFSGKKLDEIYMMGLLHDVGKIGVPDAVINKPAKLSEEEFQTIKNHPVMGARILGNIKEMPSLAVGARWHHERFDGKGYPDGLEGTDIPREARIIAVADSYDAMTSHRSYRQPLPQSAVKQELINGKGTQFDPDIADVMLAIMEEDKDYELREV